MGWLLLSQSAFDPGSAIGGSLTVLGPLGGFLYWVMFHYIPTRDKQFQTVLDAKDQQTATLIKEYREDRAAKDAAMERMQASYANLNTLHLAAADTTRREFTIALKDTTTQIVNHCAEETERLRDSWVRSLDKEIKIKVHEEVKKQIENDGTTLPIDDKTRERILRRKEGPA